MATHLALRLRWKSDSPISQTTKDVTSPFASMKQTSLPLASSATARRVATALSSLWKRQLPSFPTTPTKHWLLYPKSSRSYWMRSARRSSGNCVPSVEAFEKGSNQGFSSVGDKILGLVSLVISQALM